MPKLSDIERQKWEIITCALNRKITNTTAAKQLNLSVRQVQRLKRAAEEHGQKAVVHHLKGQPSNHQIAVSVRQQALTLVSQHYADFKPKFAAEKLVQKHHLKVHPETLRLWMAKEKLWKVNPRKRPKYYCWRERKAHYGELEQFDGSYHPWLENRLLRAGQPVELCLLAAIDDATGQITRAEFAHHEGVTPVFSFWKSYVTALGKPGGIYLDKYSTYKINYPGATDNTELLTQFQRAMWQLGIRIICANSPQAKGRVERLFGTLQDRLVKELRLAKINTLPTANHFLTQTFIPQFNRQFGVKARKEGDVHLTLSKTETKNLDSIFSQKYSRRVNQDFTIQFKNQWYQLHEIQPVTVRPKEEVAVEVWLDQSTHFKLRQQELKTFLLPQRPAKISKSQPAILTTHKLNWKPPDNHPWRLPVINARRG